MSSYYPPNHNRLLELENQLQRQRGIVPSARQCPSRPSFQESPDRRSSQGRPNFGRRSPAKPQTQFVDYPLSPPARHTRQPQQTEALRHVSPPVALQKSTSISTGASAGSYRQLATQMGKHYRVKTMARTSSNDLPSISTPLSPTVVESCAGPPSAPPKLRPQVTTPAAIRRTQAPPSPPVLPSWKVLAMTIRQAKQRQPSTNLAAIALDANQPSTVDWAIDEVFTDEVFTDEVFTDEVFTTEPETPSSETESAPTGARDTRSEPEPAKNTAPTNIQAIDVPRVNMPPANLRPEAPSAQVPASEPSAQPLSNGRIMPADIPASSVTIDVTPEVTPVTPSAPTASQTYELSPGSSAIVPQGQGAKTSALVRYGLTLASKKDTDTAGCNNNLLMMMCQLMCLHQIAGYLAQLQQKHSPRKSRKRKRSSSAHQKKSLRSHRHAS